MTLRGYWQAARQARYALLFALPLLLLYEGLSFALTQSAYAGVRNGAHVLLKTLFVAFGGPHGLAAFSLLIVGVGGALETQKLGMGRTRTLAGDVLEEHVRIVNYAEASERHPGAGAGGRRG